MIYFLFGIALFSGIVALNSLLKVFTVATGKGRWHSSAGPFLNYLFISVFGTLSVFLFMKTIPVIFG